MSEIIVLVETQKILGWIEFCLGKGKGKNNRGLVCINKMQCSKTLKYITLFNPHNIPAEQSILCPFWRRNFISYMHLGIGGTEEYN